MQCPPPRGRPWRRPQRNINLIDAENVAGTSAPSRLRLARTKQLVEAAVPVGPDDHTVVAADRRLALDVGLTWTGARLILGHGRDGADLALLEWAADADLTRRFDGAVIASGDFAFVDLVVALRRAGLPVTVTAWRRSCSRQLASAASSVRWLDPVPAIAAHLEVPHAA